MRNYETMRCVSDSRERTGFYAHGETLRYDCPPLAFVSSVLTLSLEYSFSSVFPNEGLLTYALVEITSPGLIESIFIFTLWSQVI